MTKQITTEQAETLNKLMVSVLHKYNIKDIIFAFIENLNGWRDENKVIEELLNSSLKADIENMVKFNLQINGNFIIQPNNLNEQIKIEELITNVFPLLNQDNQYTLPI